MHHLKQRDGSLQNITMLLALKYSKILSTSAVIMIRTATLHKTMLTNQTATALPLWFRTWAYRYHSVFECVVIVSGIALRKISQ